ncbi:RNA polymerase sigma factor [Muriicola soli]|uniref:RNA polymerase sigma factor n=1 Tax=Muriicola soli TaxID=2507538 RepID=A0A411E7C9_9FLAO|nr:RNA polymerase sigma factor [Muriicola soli]QBA63589.1 RNA polymerase sigma factor [Muriicola soli]
MLLPEEKELISQSLQGNHKAYGVLVDRYKYLIYTLACRMLNNREDAEEVAQDTFVKAYKSLNTFNGDAKFSSWLYRIAYRKCLDRLKKEKRRPGTKSLEIDGVKDLRASGNVLDYIEGEERSALLKAAIDRLSEIDAALVTLYYYEQLTIREISGILDMSQNVIKVRLFRSRKHLGQLLVNKTEVINII